MATPTLHWPNLAPYNLIAQVAEDKKGNSVLLLRPSNAQENPEISVRRAELLQGKLTGLADQIGSKALGSRVLQDSINVIMGPLVSTPEKMNRFLTKLFPKATTLELTADQIRQFDYIRQQAQQVAESDQITKDSQANLDALNDALPEDLYYKVNPLDSNGRTVVSLHSEDIKPALKVITIPGDFSGKSNGQMFDLIKDSLAEVLNQRKTSDREQIQLRLEAIQDNQTSKVPNFWQSEFARLETQILEQWMAESSPANQTIIPANPDGSYTLDQLIEIRDTLQGQLDDQGYVMDDRLVKRLSSIKETIAEIRKENAAAEGNSDEGAQPPSDNVQYDANSEEVSPGLIGYNFAGETLYSNGDGVRYKIKGDIRINEKVKMIPSRAGMKSEPVERDMTWLTFDEALERSDVRLTLGHRVRALYNHQFGAPDSTDRQWKAMTLDHLGEKVDAAVRPTKDEGELSLVQLFVDDRLGENRRPTLKVIMVRIVENGRGMTVEQPGRNADAATLKTWASLGLSLPTGAPQEAINQFESIKAELDYEDFEETQYGQGESEEKDHANDGRESADRAGDERSEPASTDAGGYADGVSAGGRSGGLPGSGRDLAGGNDSDVPASVADGEPSGESAGGNHVESGERSDPEGSEGSAGDQQGEEVHAGMVAQGTGGSGRDGADAGTDSATGTGNDSESATGVEGRTGDSASVPGQPDPTPEGALAEESTSDRGDGGSGRPQTGLLDGADGESSENRTGGPGTVSGSDGSAGSPAGLSSDANQTRAGGEDTGSEVPASEGSDSDADADGERSGSHSGRRDRGTDGEQQPVSRDGVIESISQNARLEERSAAERLKDNMAALRLLNELRGDEGDINPSDEEREILAKYSGFGGIHARMFGGMYNVPKDVAEASEEIRQMTREGNITSEELQRLQGTILNAHYTHSGIIEPMWEAMDRMGVRLDRVLEPSSGIGNFRTYMPDGALAKVKSFTGVEYDSLTADLARLVHKNDTVIQSGFEKTNFPDSFFDAAVSNVPFGDYRVFDPTRPERKSSIHNMFFQKALDKVRPGGVVGFVTSRYVMDSKDKSVRKDIMDRAHVMGVYRLPRQAFDKSTGTQVVTDIVFLQKKGDFTPNYAPLDILDTQSVGAEVHGSGLNFDDQRFEPGDTVPHFADINGLFVREPNRILGNLRAVTGRFQPEITVMADGETDVASQKERISKAFESLPTEVTDAEYKTITAEDIVRMNDSNQKVATRLSELPGALSLDKDGSIRVLVGDDQGNVWSERNTSFPKNMQKRAAAVIVAMRGLSELLDMETGGETDDETLDEKRADVRQLFDEWEAFEQKTKAAFSKKAWRQITNDPRAQRMRFAEIYNEETREITRPDILFGRTVRPVNEIPSSADSIEDALSISLAYTAMVSETYIAKLMSHGETEVSAQEVREQLIEKGLAFADPLTNRLVERAVYLSGNLRPKIDACESIVDTAPEFQRNLDALKDALPEPLTASQIKVGIDAFWIPQDDMTNFLNEALGITTTGNFGVKPYFDDFKRTWRMEPTAISGKPSLASIARGQDQVLRNRWGTKRRHGLDLLDNLFTNTIPKVLDPIPDTDPTRYKINTEETLKAQAKAEEIQDAFNRWIFKDPQRTKRLVDIYNTKFNTTVLYDPDGSHMKFPGMAANWEPRKHQADFIWRAVSGYNSMTAHVVGAGKTLQLIGSAIRGKQLGRWNKPLVVVPNHMLEQFGNDGQDIYPNAKILVMSAADARGDNRAAFAAKMAMGDWDMIVCTHSVFEKITVPQEFEAELLENEIARMEAAMDNEDKKSTPKEIEKAKKRLEERLERTLDSINRGSENVLNLEEVGIDWIGVDEAHYYKNLMPDTSQQIPGVSNASSKRATNMLLKCQYLHSVHNGPYGVMMATGTPISNSVAECYTFSRMLRPDLLEEMEIFNFNDWMGLFGQIKHGMEMKPEGGGYQMKSRLSRFKNLPELIKMIRTFIDFKTREDLNLPTPNVVTENVSSDQSEFMGLFMKYIEARAKGVRAGKDGPTGIAEDLAKETRHALYRANDKTAVTNQEDEVDPDAIDAPTDDILLTIATDGRKAALDTRLIHPKFKDEANSKVNKGIEQMMSLYRRYNEQKALQLVFCDFSSPTGKGLFNVYDDVKQKLISAGVPEEEIAFIHDAKTDKDKEDLFAACRRGDKRFLLGSTDKMGVGTNVQERLVALHQFDPPWKPSNIEQRLGRMDRQGNMFDEVYNFIYTTKDSFDLFMWETLNRKLQMVNQAMRRPEDCAREIEEDFEPGYEDILSITTGNPAIREFMNTRQELDKLKRMRDSHIDAQADLGTRIIEAEKRIEAIDHFLQEKVKERDLVSENTPLSFIVDGPVPGISDGPMGVVGGVKPLSDVLEKLAEGAPAYRVTDIGMFGGLPVQIERLGRGITLSVARSWGKSEQLYKLNMEDDIWEQGVHDDPVDHFAEAAKTLIRYVRKIGRDNGIQGTEERLEMAKNNLQALQDDHGKPFVYEKDLEHCRKRFDELSAQVGDELDESKSLDPTPIIEFIKSVHSQTGDHDQLIRVAREKMNAGAGALVDTQAEAEEDTDDIEEFDYLSELDEINDWNDPREAAGQ